MVHFRKVAFEGRTVKFQVGRIVYLKLGVRWNVRMPTGEGVLEARNRNPKQDLGHFPQIRSQKGLIGVRFFKFKQMWQG